MSETKQPRRVQLRRTKGWRLQEYSRSLNGLDAVKVDRSTPWGNPFHPFDMDFPDKYPPEGIQRHMTAKAVERFREAVETEDILDIIYIRWTDCTPYHRFATIEGWLNPLRGKNLACWCSLDEKWCHAEVLLDLANQPVKPGS